MFAKPFRIKSQTQIKGSDRKKLRVEMSNMYPSLTPEDLSALIPSKEEVILVRMYCHKGESVIVYQVQKDPMFFMIEREKEIYPTVYMMWKFPDLLHTFTTHDRVINVLLGGADLMLPGVVLDGPISPTAYGKFDKGLAVSVDTEGNAAAQAIGTTAHSSMDMYMCGGRGKAVNIMHVYRDHLWEMGSKTLVPDLGPPLRQVPVSAPPLREAPISAPPHRGSKGSAPEGRVNDPWPPLGQTQESDPWPQLGKAQKKDSPPEVTEGLWSVEGLKLDDAPEKEDAPRQEAAPEPEEEEQSPELSGPEAMDKLLLHCFLKAWKTTAKKVEPPILTSNFYRLHMVRNCPDGQTLDIKKSSYKKLSKFLNEMAKKELIQVKEFPKGVENITAINWAHEELKSFVVDMSETTAKPEPNSGSKNSFTPPTIEEVYQVSGDTLQFFKSIGLSKGDVLLSNEVRQCVTTYIKRGGLQKEGQKTVNLDPVLHEAVVNRKEGFKETLRWDEIFSRMLGKMAPAVRITRPGYVPIIRKGKLEPIELNVAKRSGNKKVTLVYNAGIYGIDENEFAHQIQVGVAASTSVGPADHKPQGTTQVLIQGNQVSFVCKLLLETYNIPRKYIRGMELAVKGKKK